MKKWFGVAWVLCGCVGGAADPRPSAEGPSASVSPTFSLSSASGAARVSAVGDGVSVQWGADRPPLSATTVGLGAVVGTRTEANDALVLTRDTGVEERWTRTETGAEQTWRFASAPASGPLRVNVAMESAQFESVDDGGVWLRVAQTERIRYGHGTWVDADGRRTPVPARWRDGRITLEVPAETVAASRFPAELDPIITPAFSVEPHDLLYNPLNAYMTKTPTGWLLFSQTTVRSTNGDPNLTTVQPRDANGQLIAGTTPLILPGVGGAQTISAAYDTGVWVVWSAGPSDARRILGMRVDFSGRALDAAPVALQPTSYNGASSIACAGSQCVLVGRSSSGAVSFQRLSGDGRVLDATPRNIASSVTAGEYPSVVALGTTYYVAWSAVPTASTADVFVARFDQSGTVLDPGGRPVTAAGSARVRPSLATDGSRLFLTFYANSAGPRPAGTYNLLLDAALAPLSSVSVITAYVSGGRAYWDGSVWVVTPSMPDGRFVRFSSAGVQLDATPVSVRYVNLSRAPSWLGVSAGSVLTLEFSTNVGTPTTGFQFRYVVRRYDLTGAPVGTESLVPSGARDVIWPTADSDGTDFLVSTESATIYPNLHLIRVRASGAVVDTTPVAPLRNMVYPAALLEGARALVFGTLGGGGAEAFSVDMTTGARGASRTLAAIAGGATVVRGGAVRLAFVIPRDPSVAGALGRFSPDGTFLDLGPTPLPPTRSMSADFDGTRFAMIYQTLVAGSFRAFARRMDTSGDYFDLSPRSLESLGEVRVGPAIAYGAGTHLIAWIDPTSQVRVTRLATDLTPATAAPPILGLSGPMPLYSEYHRDREVRVVFDGTNFVVAWINSTDSEVRVVRVSPAGAVLDASPFVVTAGTLAPTTRVFAMASDGRGSTLIVFEAIGATYAAIESDGVFFREDGVMVADGGVTPTDVPSPTDTGVDASMDVPRDVVVTPDDVAVMDAADAGETADASSDAPTPADAALPDDARADDASVDVAPADVASADVASPSDRPSTDAGGLSDAVASSDARAADVAAADAGPPPADDGGLCDVRGRPGSGRSPGLPLAGLCVAMVLARRRTSPRTARTR